MRRRCRDIADLGGNVRPATRYRSKRVLVALIGGNALICKPVSAAPTGGSAYDRYGRVVARCFVNGRDIGAYTVANGFAIRWPLD
jgi:endonuclease YncB( thermonuclease family)